MVICVISGSVRPERRSHQVAELVMHKLAGLARLAWLWDMRETELETAPAPDRDLISARLESTDAFIIISPEYEGTFPCTVGSGLSYFPADLAGKLFALVGVSGEMPGGINAIRGLRGFIAKLNGVVSPQFVTTPRVHELFKDGKVDEKYSRRLDRFLENFTRSAAI